MKIKHKSFIDVVQNYALSKLIVRDRFKDLWRIENPEFYKFTRYNRSSSLRCRIDRVYHHVNIANNTKINHIMISLTGRCTDISIDKLPLKTKTGKNSWYFSNSLLCKPDFFSATNDLFSLLITQKNKYYSTRTFLKISPLKKI